MEFLCVPTMESMSISIKIETEGIMRIIIFIATMKSLVAMMGTICSNPCVSIWEKGAFQTPTISTKTQQQLDENKKIITQKTVIQNNKISPTTTTTQQQQQLHSNNNNYTATTRTTSTQHQQQAAERSEEG